jgi:uncharacterized membrane protein (DUF441 family)
MSSFSKWIAWGGIIAVFTGFFLAWYFGADVGLWMRRAVLTLVLGGAAVLALAFFLWVIQGLADIESER